MFKKLFFISLITMFNIAFAGSNSITGKVIDKNGIEALTGAEVTIKELGKTFYTDFDGRFHIPNLDQSKTYTLVIHFVSYDEKVIHNLSPQDIQRGLVITLAKQ
ncbi:MAG: carboxypeptidase-like regulatory domain-containing protein [Cytophagales bacterium]|nr:carboxypeptidase-like regulatory domain-containing protein [Cytophagales bacterium]